MVLPWAPRPITITFLMFFSFIFIDVKLFDCPFDALDEADIPISDAPA
jgi:hypothetical protein